MNGSNEDPEVPTEATAADQAKLQVQDESVAGEEQTAGVFLLEPALNSEADGRPGASLAAWENDDLSAADSELPMVVWLRGDELWYPQFELDADAVMARLGIKRSRLTQISGKELRVGRVRVDRYIKPVFRTSDVEAYLAWTRATASHQKSSSALKDAAQVLQSQSEHIAHIVSDASAQFSEALRTGLLVQLEDVATRSLKELADKVEKLESEITSANEEKDSQLSRRQELLMTQLVAQDMRFDAVENAIAAVALRLAELSDRQLQVIEQQASVVGTLAACKNQLTEQGLVLQSLVVGRSRITKQTRRKKLVPKSAQQTQPAQKFQPQRRKRHTPS